MIVKCDQCQTRFKIPDEKVTEKGVKVRCTRCQNTFRVTRAPEPKATDFDPFAGMEQPARSRTQEQFDPFAALDATKPAAPVPAQFDPFAALADPSENATVQVTRPGAPMPRPPASARPDPLGDRLENATVQATHPGVPVPRPTPTSMQFDPFAVGDPSENATVQVTRPGGRVPRPTPAPTQFDPFAMGDPSENATVQVTHPGAQLPKPPPAAQQDYSGVFAAPTLPVFPPGSDTSVRSAPEAPPPTPRPVSSAPVTGARPAYSYPSAAAAPAPSGPTLPAFDPAGVGAFDEVDFNAPTRISESPSGPHRVAGAPGPSAFEQTGSGTFAPAIPSAPVPTRNLLEDVPPVSREELFGEMGSGFPSTSVSPPPEASLGTNGADPLAAAPALDNGFFDVPAGDATADASQTGAQGEDGAAASVVIGKLKLAKVAVSADPVLEVGRAKDEPASESASAARRVSGVLINLAVAAGLVLVLATVINVYRNEGKVDASSVSLARMKALFVPASDRVAVDVSNGLYETQHGRPIFFVRGEVENRGDETGKVRVRAEILDGTQLVRAAEGYAGAVPSPEELYAIGSPQDAEALAARLDKGAVELRPGERAPFLLAFYEYPPELAGLGLRVTVLDGEQPAAAR